MQMLSKLANLKKHRSRACLGARKPLIKRQKLKEPRGFSRKNLGIQFYFD